MAWMRYVDWRADFPLLLEWMALAGWKVRWLHGGLDKTCPMLAQPVHLLNNCTLWADCGHAIFLERPEQTLHWLQQLTPRDAEVRVDGE
jgi:pimeloyl-ACP methyl ester carboxylesterase